MEREKQVIKGALRQLIEGERSRIKPDRQHQEPVEVSLTSLEYQFTFTKKCKAAVVTASYVWQIRGPAMAPVDSRRRRTFGCAKVFGAWICS